MTNQRVPRGLLFLLVLLSLTLLPLPTHAADDTPAGVPSFVVEPVGQPGSYITLTINPGVTVSATVALGNAGTEAVNARTYAADVYTIANGGFGLTTADAPVTGTARWLDYTTEEIDLAPLTKIERTFHVSVPEKTKPGQYIAGIALETAEPIAVGGSDMLKQTIVKAIAVFITVPGPVEPKLEIGEATIKQSGSGQTLVVAIKNPGNVLLKPAGTLELTAAGGTVILTTPVQMGSVYARTDTTLEVAIPTVLDPGTYGLHLDLRDEATGAAAQVRDLAVPVKAPSTETPDAPVTIASFALTPVSDQATGNLQIVNVEVTIANTGAPVANARLTLHVERDGQVVEDFPLNASLAIPTGSTPLTQRYAPIGGWSAGVYTFSVTLEAIDPSTGQVTLLATANAPDTVTVQ